MSIIVDLLIVGIIVLSAVRYYKLGLVCSLLSFGKFILAFVLAGILRVPFTTLLLRLIFGEKEYSSVQSAFAGVISYVVIFAAVIAVSSFVITKLSHIKIPIIAKFDKLLGLAFGLVIGLFVASLFSTAFYTAVEFISAATHSTEMMSIYSDSYVFRFIKDISLFEFLRSNIGS